MAKLVRVIVASLAIILAAHVGAVTSENNDAVPPTNRNAEDALNGGPIATYRMANFFLDSIVQTTYLTGLKLDIITLDQLKDSFSADWEEWVLYWVGFVVCAGLGLVMGLTVLMTCFVMPCCRCCGRCGGKKYKEDDLRPTRCKRVGCSVALGVISVALLLGVIPLFLVNERLYEQIGGEVITDAVDSLNGVSRFIDQSVHDVNTTLGDGYVTTQDEVFLILDSIPEDAMAAIDKATGILPTLEVLTAFSNSLQPLQKDLEESVALAAKLETDTNALSNDYEILQSNMSVLDCTSEACQRVKILIDQTPTFINFEQTKVLLIVAERAIQGAIDRGMENLTQSANDEVQNVQDKIDSEISQPISDIKTDSKNIEREIFDFIDELDKALNTFDIEGIIDDIKRISSDDLYKLLVDVIYWSVVGLCSMIVIIIALTTLGLLCGLLLRPTRAGASCCSLDQSIGARLLMSGVILTLLFYWVYCLFVFCVFLAGGVAHTEVCRHVEQVNNTKHFEVLSMFDGWINEMIESEDMDLYAFDAYRQCSANRTLYRALSAEQYWNLTAMMEENLVTVEEAIDDLKKADVDIPPVDYANDDLMGILGTLENTFGPDGLVDFDAMSQNITGPVVVPLLTELAGELNGLRRDIDYTNEEAIIDGFAEELIKMNADLVQPIESGRDELIHQMHAEQATLSSISFQETADALNSSQNTINNEGDAIVAVFLDTTGDQIYHEISSFAESSVDSVENEIARCEPLYQNVATVFDATCVRTLYPINGFWYSLGWCLVFFIPYLFLATNLATVFRFVLTGTGYRGASPNSVGHMDDEEVEGVDMMAVLDPNDLVRMEKKELALESPSPNDLEMKALFYKDLRPGSD